MRCGDNRAAFSGVQSTTRPPRRARRGELIKLATHPSDRVGCPARHKVTHLDAYLRGRTPANTARVFARRGGSR
jgi:hypothetical protein